MSLLFLSPFPACRVALLAFVFCATAVNAAEQVSGEMMANPYFEGANYDHWEFSGKWRPDGKQQRIVFDLDEHNVGFPSAVGRCKYLSLGSADASTSARLTGFAFNRPYIAVYNAASIGAGADYRLYFEVDVQTTNGSYRAKSQAFAAPWKLPSGELELKFDWIDDGDFLGAPSNHPNGGIPIRSIEETYYKAVMQVNQATDSGTGTVYITLDNCSLEYLVTFE